MEKAERTLRERLQMLADRITDPEEGEDGRVCSMEFLLAVRDLALETADALDNLYENGRRRLAFTGDFRDPQVEIPIYDREEIHHNCTVQVLRNSFTGQTSVGWWKEEEYVSE